MRQTNSGLKDSDSAFDPKQQINEAINRFKSKQKRLKDGHIEFMTYFENRIYIFEQIAGERYVKWNKTDDTWESIFEIDPGLTDTDGERIIYKPRPEEGGIVLPDEPIKCESLTEVFNDFIGIYPKFFFISERMPPFFHVQVLLSIGSWFIEAFDRLKYVEKAAGGIDIIGPSATGKKRWITILKLISYRSFEFLFNDSIPSIYRALEPWRYATLFLNEADSQQSGPDTDVAHYLNGRYDATPFPKFNIMTHENEFFNSFGLTGLAIRRAFEDTGIVTRHETVEAVESEIYVPEVAGEDLEIALKPLRQKLLYLRLKYLPKLKPIATTGLGIDINWRVKESLFIIKLMSQVDPTIVLNLNEIAQKLTEQKVRDLSLTWEGVLLGVFNDFLEDALVDETADGLIYFYKFVADDEDRVKAFSSRGVAYSLNLEKGQDSKVGRDLRQFGFVRTKVPIQGRRFNVLALPGDRLRDLNRALKRYVLSYNDRLLIRAQKFSQQRFIGVRFVREYGKYRVGDEELLIDAEAERLRKEGVVSFVS